MSSSTRSESYGQRLHCQGRLMPLGENTTGLVCPGWVQDLNHLEVTLSDTDIALLDQHIRYKPLTTDVLLASTLPHVETYDRKWFQETLRRLDPLFSHIISFSSVVDVFVQTNPSIPGLIWGSVHLAITVCCRATALFETVVGMLADFAPSLSFFSRSKKLFERMESKDLETAVEAVCTEMVLFCLAVAKYCQRSPITNFFRVLFQPGLEAQFRQYNERLKKKIALAEKEVVMCDMQATQQGLQQVHSLIRDVPGRLQLPPPSKRFIRMIPYSQNERFFGRDALLDELSKTLSPARLPKRQRKFALYGLGGCGKTQVALEYVYRHFDQYQVILWISSSSIEKIEKDFAEAAILLGLAKPVMHANEARQFALQTLIDTDLNYLIVFDNVEDISLLRSYLPHTNHGAIIVTTRDSVMSKSDFKYAAAVPEFTVDEGYQFLATILPHLVASCTEFEMRKTSEILGGLPLALSQVAEYILSEDCKVGDFLRVYHDQRKQQEFVTRAVSDYELTLSTVWKLSFSTLDLRCQYLLDILTFFDPDGVPHKLLTEGARSLVQLSADKCETSAEGGRLHFLADQNTFQGLLRTLRKQSLLRTNLPSSSFTIHRLVQEYASQRLSSDGAHERAVFADALSLLACVQPKDDYTRHWSPHLWDSALVYLPHVRALESRFREKPAAFRGYENDLAKLLFNCANYLFERNRYNLGLETIWSARTIADASPHRHYALLSDLYRLEGRLCNETNLPDRGLDAFRTAFALAKDAVAAGQLEASDTRCVRTLTGWGNCLNQLDRFDEALDLQLQASQACAAEPEKHGDAQSIVLLNLGYVYFKQGDLDKAEETFRQAQQLDEKLQPVLYALANIAVRRGDAACGLRLHQEALKLYMDEFGEQHHCVADSLFKVGETCLKLGRACTPGAANSSMLSEAVIHLHQSLAMYRSEGQYFDGRAAISRGARMLALALQSLPAEHSSRTQGLLSLSPGDLLREAFDLHKELTGVDGSVLDTDEEYSSLMFYWSR